MSVRLAVRGSRLLHIKQWSLFVTQGLSLRRMVLFLMACSSPRTSLKLGAFCPLSGTHLVPTWKRTEGRNQGGPKWPDSDPEWRVGRRSYLTNASPASTSLLLRSIGILYGLPAATCNSIFDSPTSWGTRTIQNGARTLLVKSPHVEVSCWELGPNCQLNESCLSWNASHSPPSCCRAPLPTFLSQTPSTPRPPSSAWNVVANAGGHGCVSSQVQPTLQAHDPWWFPC